METGNLLMCQALHEEHGTIVQSVSSWSTWPAWSEEHVTPDPGVVSAPVGYRHYLIKKKKKKECQLLSQSHLHNS